MTTPEMVRHFGFLSIRLLGRTATTTATTTTTTTTATTATTTATTRKESETLNAPPS